MSKGQHTEQSKPQDGGAQTEHPIDVRFDELLERLAPYWPDLVYQGSIQQKFDQSPTATFVLQFRQHRSGSRDGRTKRLYVGKSEVVANAVMNEIWQRREEAGTRRRPRKRPRPEVADHPSLAEFIEEFKRQNPMVVFTEGYAGLVKLLELENRLIKEKRERDQRDHEE